MTEPQTKKKPAFCVDNPPRLALRPREAAAALGIGVRKLWELTNRGEIPCVRCGRAVIYPVGELERWLSARATGGQEARR